MMKLLVVDDERSMCELLVDAARLRKYDAVCETSPKAGLDRLDKESIDIVLTDLKMPEMDGIEFCRRVLEKRTDIPVIVMTAFGSMETAVDAIRAGAFDFITKPIDMSMLEMTLGRATRHRELHQQVKVLSEQVDAASRVGEMIGESAVMSKLYDQLSRIAASDASVLITGESGSGKELVARSIHQQSHRVDNSFVAVNCAALPETLLESELFGHAKGAFTDARADRQGLFLEADEGTLFLDEIGEMPLTVQPKLLRALEESKLRQVGGTGESPFDVRLLAATNRDLESSIEGGMFREDLFFRINVIQVDVPPLRSRGTDVLLLAKHFVQQFTAKARKEVTSISEPAAERLMAYNWPGNVRELRNTIERAIALTRHDSIVVDDLPDKIREHRGGTVVLGSSDPEELLPLDQIERQYIQHVLESVDGNKTRAARILGLDRKTLYRKLKEGGQE